MPVRRPAAPQFVALSDLAHQPLSSRDFLALLPVVLISFALNAAFIGGMAWFMSGDATAKAALKTRTDENETTHRPKDPNDSAKDKPPIEVDLKDFPQPVPEQPPIQLGDEVPVPKLEPEKQFGIEAPMKPEDLPGIGRTKLGGIDGDRKEDPSAPGVPGQPLIGFKDMGRPGNAGAGPTGDGLGLPTAQGGYTGPGGYGDRTGNLDAIASDLGGTKFSQQAVALGLEWLKKHQSRDGHWSLDRYNQVPDCNCRLAYESAVRADDLAATALGLLPFLGAGHHHQRKSAFQDVVCNGLNYMLRHQGEDGKLGLDMYSHGLGTIALCEAYALSKDEHLRSSAQRAVDYILRAQHKRLGQHYGGWRYDPRYETSDTSIVGWQVMALKSAQMANLEVPPKALADAQRFLDNCWVKKIPNDRNPQVPFQGYSYLPSGPPTQTMTAVALLGRLYYGWGPLNRDLLAGCDWLMTDLPPLELGANDEFKIYYWYYATQVMHHLGGPYFDTWNPRIRDLLIKTQERAGHKAGSWDPTPDPWARHGGRIYTTSLSILTLEVYYRYLPLYRHESVAVAPKPEASGK